MDIQVNNLELIKPQFSCVIVIYCTFIMVLICFFDLNKCSGDTDGIVPVTSTKKSIKKMKLRVETPWYPWFHGDYEVCVPVSYIDRQYKEFFTETCNIEYIIDKLGE